MRTPRHLFYLLRKSFAIYPGVRSPVAAGFLQPHYRRRQESRSLPRSALDAVVGAAFRLWVPWRARRVAAKFQLGADWQRRAARLGRERFADPNDLALFRIEQPEQLDSYIRRYEVAAINKQINPANWTPGCVLLDKSRFYARCREAGLPHPPVLAMIVNGTVDVQAAPAQAELILKPADGEGGAGFRLITLPAPIPDRGDFAHYLRSTLADLRHAWIVQPRIRNHPSMRPLAMEALATARMTTILNEHGEPEIVTSVLRFPSDPASNVDNIKSGGLMAPIELARGTLGDACRGRSVGEVSTHPVTGVEIAGIQLPWWQEAKALVIRAHAEMFREYTLIGWDVALTADGPMLIEGNGKPCMIVAQRAARSGIGEQRYGDLIAWHLGRSARSS